MYNNIIISLSLDCTHRNVKDRIKMTCQKSLNDLYIVYAIIMVNLTYHTEHNISSLHVTRSSHNLFINLGNLEGNCEVLDR